MKQVMILIVALLWMNQSYAAFNLKQFDNPEHAARYEDLIYQIRCLVCQNQTIADSDADLAKDLRNEIHKKILSGQSDQQIIDFMVERYGEFVLYKPRMQLKTWLLWGGPALLLITGIIILIFNHSRRNKQVDLEIDQHVLKKAQNLLDKDNNQ
ncbi:MAG: cytochrome c-type biogenesis protein [Methylococcales bacterium]